MQVRNWAQGATFKAMAVGLLTLLMLIPLGQVRSLIQERQGLEYQARQQIADRWGEAQMIGGPVLVVPLRKQVQGEKGWVVAEQEHYLFPEQLTVQGQMRTETRSYGIYATPVYTAALTVSGRFDSAAMAALDDKAGEPQWKEAVLRVPISDVSGIRQLSPLTLDGTEHAFGPGGHGLGEFATTEVAWPLENVAARTSHEFSFELSLAGTASISVLPLARQTDVRLGADWPDPSFSGAFLPASHEETDGRFQAQWQVLDLNRRYGQSDAVDSLAGSILQQSAFGVELYQPVATYQRNERAGKYGILFIAMSFVTLFLFEALGRWRVHPVQYLMVGLALCTFYVVLLALSEQIGFGWAYAIAAMAVVAIVGGYAAAAAGTRSAGKQLGALLALVYLLLYGLVVSEQYSLLMGAIALLAAIAALMYLTRRIDWYGLGVGQLPATGRMPS